MRHISPLRYPGGKAVLVDFLDDTIELNNLHGCVYYEPYAGGAGAALGLLKSSAVSELYLNDADWRVFSFWHAVLNESAQFVDKLRTVSLTVDEWHRQHAICLNPKAHTQFEVGFGAFFMNRCNRSGVITGAGPIGGYEQTGKWRMGVRFNREELAERVLALNRMKSQIHVCCEDAVSFLKKKLPHGRGREKVFVYLDPPYVVKGQRLYLNAYAPKDHAVLASYLGRQSTLPWIMSYDDSALVRQLYFECDLSFMPIRYSLQAKRPAQELVIAPKHVAVPRTGREDLCMRESAETQ